MSTKTDTKNHVPKTRATGNIIPKSNGALQMPPSAETQASSDEHLAKANRAMTRAWEMISQRRNRGD